MRLRSDSPSETRIGDKMRVCTATICFETRVGDRMRMCAADFVRNRRRALVTAFVCVCASLPSPQRAVYTGEAAITATVGVTVDPLGDFTNSLPSYCQQLLPGACGTGGGICYRGPICPSMGKSPLSQVFLQKNLREVGAFTRIFTKSSGDNLRETFRDNVVLRFPL